MGDEKMRQAQTFSVIVSIAVGVLGLVHLTREAAAQSGTRTQQKAHYEVLWNWLQQHDYRQWDGGDGQPPEFQPGKSPHGALIKTYVSKRAGGDLKNLPDGSGIVKENFMPDK